MKQDDKITKKFLLELFKENNKDLNKDFNEAILESEKRTAGSIVNSEKRIKKVFIENIKAELSGLRKEVKEAITDAEKRIKGSLMLEIKELSESIFKLEMKEDKHYNFMIDKLDWLVGAYKKFEEEHDIHSVTISEHTDKLENYLQRLKTLEVRAAQPV